MHYAGQDHQVGDGGEGPLTLKLREMLCGIHARNSEPHPKWIHVVPEK